MLPEIPGSEDLRLETRRLLLEPVELEHAEELWRLFADRDLHSYVPFEPPSLEKQIERCGRWARRISPEGDEIWLNWIVRQKVGPAAIGHVQSGIKSDDNASIGYLISRQEQGRGFATEALSEVLEYLRDRLHVRMVTASIDTRNRASIALAKKLGMKQTGFIKDADHFKGSSSDEFIFSISLAAPK